MSTNLSRFFKDRRLDKKISLGQLARTVGYENLTKGSRRISTFEDQGMVHEDLLPKLTLALHITRKEIEQCLEKDRAEFQQWANERIEPYLVVRLMAAIYSRKSVPGDLTEEEMIAFASSVAADNQMQVCLVLSRIRSAWFDEGGKLTRIGDGTDLPYMLLGKKVLLNWFDEDKPFVEEVASAVESFRRGQPS